MLAAAESSEQHGPIKFDLWSQITARKVVREFVRYRLPDNL